MLRTGMDVCLEFGLKPGQKSYSDKDFAKIEMTMVVACTACRMTMSILSPTVRVCDEDFFWCKECAPEEDNDAVTQAE